MTRGVRSRTIASAVGVALVAAACSSKSPPQTTSATLREGVVARVGNLEISARSVADIARAQAVDVRRARDIAIRDALLAAAADGSPEGPGPATRLGESALYARTLLRDIAREAEQAGPVTDAELATVTARHWQELDRPPAFRTVHALVRLDENAPEDRRRAAAAVADAIRRAIEPAREVASTTQRPETSAPQHDADPATGAFRAAVDGVDKAGFDLVVEELPPVTADGRVVGPDARFDERFAKAAAALAHRGDVTAPVRSPFGFHVIMLLEELPGHVVPSEERRQLVREEVMSERGRALEQSLLVKLRADALVDPSADALLAEVPVDPGGSPSIEPRGAQP